ncbi:hypothetical protein DICVIV_05792 [Dictyocaulus viviparus]|uniref:Uncharacterized protein n=1 Tax=Dictyocaulus viviparus TaxID=29172 RepID=A0A0D8Y0F2_DICVI|nr:hypothetical protein DICVIV_05792 [Dictyocaulus viviparus]
MSSAKKRCRIDSDDEVPCRSDRGINGEDEPDEYDDGDELCHGKDDIIEPHIMLEYVKDFRQFVTEKGKLYITVSRMKGLFGEWLAYRQKDSPTHDLETILKSFKRYVTASVKPVYLSMDCCFRSVSEYLSRPESVLMYPDFPEVIHKMQEDNEGRQECERELCELEKAFLKKMEDFLVNNHEVMLPNQTKYVQHRIHLTRKKLFPSERSIKARQATAMNGSEPKQEKTAFDLFCSTKMDKYVELPAEVRLRKLRKKFEKLSEDKREIFEKLALLK